MKILIYEDDKYKDLFPLNMLRAVYDIRCGAYTIKERIKSITEDKYEIVLHCRKSLEKYLKEVHRNKINSFSKDELFLINGRMIFNKSMLNFLISKKEKNSYYTFKNEIVAAFISKENSDALKNKTDSGSDGVITHEYFKELGLKEIGLKESSDIFEIKFPWDPIRYLLNGGFEDDLEYFLKDNKKFNKVKESSNFINRRKILISKTTKIFPNVTVDASGGAVVICDNAIIEPFTFLKGPVFIGKNVYIKSGTKIYGPCVIGENSKVAGEIAESVFHSYVNKQHEGFVGHSYICPFVNLGADTVTSDLKNNYSEIRIKLNEKDVDTEMRFLGSIIGDHSKTSINTMLNTGSLIGIFANIFGGGFPHKEIKSFSWNEAGKNSLTYNIDKALETASIVMSRRGIRMGKVYKDLILKYSEENIDGNLAVFLK